MIDRRREPAVYRRVADDLAARIEAGEYRPGDSLPSADLICRTYSVGMVTANRALLALKQDGLIDTEAGRQARVRAPEERHVVWLESEAQWVARMPTARERHDYDIPEGVPVAIVTAGEIVTLYRCDRVVFRPA